VVGNHVSIFRKFYKNSDLTDIKEVSMEISKNQLHKAGIDAVISELKKYGIPSLLPHSRSAKCHLFVSQKNQEVKLTVKAKQKTVWPAVKGLSGSNNFLILVDFEGKKPGEGPTFFVLDEADYKKLADAKLTKVKNRNPNKRVNLDGNKTVVWVDEIGKDGESYKGIAIQVDDVNPCLEKWDKITRIFG
jgi:hypothetical protein